MAERQLDGTPEAVFDSFPGALNGTVNRPFHYPPPTQMQRTQAKRGRPTKAEQEKKKAQEIKQQQQQAQADAVLTWAQANVRSLMLVCDVLRLAHEPQQAIAVEELHRITAELAEALV